MNYAERFYELSKRKFEFESAADSEITVLLHEMERDYFWGKAKKFWKRPKKAVKSPLKRGMIAAAGKLSASQAMSGITQLSRGNLKGLLGSLAKAGLASAIPGGAAALPGLRALGFAETEDVEINKAAWASYVIVAREGFDYLARNLDEKADNPLHASRLAAKAFHTALKRAQSHKPTNKAGRGNSRAKVAGGRKSSTKRRA